MAQTNFRVVLLKSEKSTEECDPYVEILNCAGFSSSVIPTLSFKFINEDSLLKYLRRAKDFCGVILTSTRSVEAIHNICNNVKEKINTDWEEKMNFSVGECTANLAKSLLGLNTLGKDAGNSEKLCNLILDYGPYDKPFLFPCGNKRKDTIPEVLTQNGILIEEVVCYETVCNPILKTSWQNLVSEQGVPGVLVFFSPSGVEFSQQLIKDTYSDGQQMKCIAIGASTKKALLNANLSPCGVAEKPNPTSVCQAVRNVVYH